MRYRHCIFDLYGTLVDIHTDERLPELWERLAGWFRAHGAPYAPDELREAYFTTCGRMEEAAKCPGTYPEIRIEEVFQSLFRDKGVEADEALAARAGERFRDASLMKLRCYDGAIQLLEALRASNCGVWLLSNAQRLFTLRELRALDLERRFDGIYLSSDYGCKKPDRRFFEALLRERGIEPESAIMIGNDGFCDIQGAREAGLATLYIRSNLSPEEPTPRADYALDEMNLDRVREILTDE